MTEESRTQKLHQLLKQLGQAVHGSVHDSKDVQACLAELHERGWEAVMLLEASLVCRASGDLKGDNASIRIHVDPDSSKASYRIDAADASWLQDLGISPDRHRSLPKAPRPDPDGQSGRQND